MKKTILTAMALCSLSLSFSEDNIEKQSSETLAYMNRSESGCNCHSKNYKNPFISVAKKSVPSVVYIRVESTDGSPYGQQDPFDTFHDEFFNRFFGGSPGPRQRQPRTAQGSGFIVTAEGHILTNYHVVAGATKMTVILQDGKNIELNAQLVGGDPQTDVALIKLDNPNHDKFPYLELGDSDDVQVGEWVLAIGNPFELQATVTKGIISAKGRQDLKVTELEDFIQTDAVINPGNSGGPLIDLEGRVIGINTAIFTQTGSYSGISFAIPSNIAKNVMKQLMDKGSVTRGFLGISMQGIDKDLAQALGLAQAEGALVADVLKDSSAEKAGIKQGDVIVELDGMPVKSPSTLQNEIMLKQPGTKVHFKVIRNGKVKHFTVILGSYNNEAHTASQYTDQLGINVEEINHDNARRYRLRDSDQGVVITSVKPGSMGAQVGLRPGYIVLSLNHQKINSLEDFNKALASVEKNKQVLIHIKHGDTAKYIAFKLK